MWDKAEKVTWESGHAFDVYVWVTTSNCLHTTGSSIEIMEIM